MTHQNLAIERSSKDGIKLTNGHLKMGGPDYLALFLFFNVHVTKEVRYNLTGKEHSIDFSMVTLSSKP